MLFEFAMIKNIVVSNNVNLVVFQIRIKQFDRILKNINNNSNTQYFPNNNIITSMNKHFKIIAFS